MNLQNIYRNLVVRIRPHLQLGLDLGEAGIKLVLADRRLEGVPIVSYRFYRETVKEEEPVSVSRFRDFLKSHKLLGLPTACNLEDPSLRIRRIDLPKMPDFDLREAVRWQLRDILDDSVDLYAVRYSILEEYQTEESAKLALVAYAVHRSAVSNRITLLRKLGLKPVLIEPNAVSLLSALDRLLPWNPNGAGHQTLYAALDLGANHSGFVAMGDHKLYFSRPLAEISEKSFLQTVVQELAISQEDAVALRESLLQKGTPDGPLQAVLPVYYGKIAIEVQRSLDTLSLLFHKVNRVERLILCGGGAVLPGLKEYLSKNVGIRTETLSPFQGWNLEGNDHHLYWVATGLALYPG